ncbi:PAS domain S-box protein [Flavobacteriales bacterium]|nr:PAS domain S-box protein [Flavobacteriales bacterium]
MPKSVSDITSEKQVLQLLEENALLKGIIQGASDAVYAKDLEGRYLIINEAGAKYLDKSAKEVIGKTDVELVGEEIGRPIMDRDGELYATEKSVSYDSVGKFNIRNRYFSTSKSPFRNKEGKVVGLVGISRDETDAKLAEAKYGFIFENAPIAFWEEDFSEVKQYLNELKKSGVKDFEKHFYDNPSSLDKCVDLIKVININQTTKEMQSAEKGVQSIAQVGMNFTKESEKVFLEEFVALANGKTSYQSEATIISRAGKTLHILFNLNVLPGHEETLDLVLISVVDVTQSKTIESELSNMKHRYQSIVEAQSEMICRIDPTGKIQFRNHAFKRFFSFKDNGGNMRFSTLFPPAQLEQAEKNLISLTTSDASGTWEYRNFDSGGNIVWQEWSINAFFGESGILLGYQAAGTDVTTRKLAQEALVASESRWRSVIENAGDIIMTVNSEGYIISINKSKELPKGVKWAGRMLDEILMPENTNQAMQLLRKVFATGSALKTEVKLKRREGGHAFFDVALSPIFSGKRVITVICIARNITENKLFEQQTKEALIQGQENERMRVSRELHDGLGQLFTAIKMNLQHLKSEIDINPNQELLNRVKVLEDNVAVAFGEVRNISRNLMPDVLKQFGLKPAIQDLLDSLNASMTVKISVEFVDFDLRLAPEIEKALFRMCQELVNNSIRHGKPEEVFVQLINHGKSVVLMVEDDGSGFDTKKLFNGFGLRNIKSRVEVFEGTVDVDSAVGRGTVTTIEIPLTHSIAT